MTVIRGDMMEPDSLGPAFDGIDAVITTAAGYTRRRKSDTAAIDTEGNKNLIDAAKNARVRRFVLCGILASDRTPEVPHFWHKKLAEDYAEESAIPFVSLRPGAFLDQSVDMFAKFASKGRFVAFGDPLTESTFVYTPDLARYLAIAVDAPGIDGERIDIGWDRPVGIGELARMVGEQTDRDIKVRTIPWWLLFAMLGAVGVFSATARDIKAMLRFIRSGRYVADTARQREVFGEVPRAEDAVARWLAQNDMFPDHSLSMRPS